MDLKPTCVFLFLALLVYLLIIFFNLTLIVTIILEKSLHEPMYLFLCNLCLNELYGTSGFYPKLIYDLFSSSYMISYTGCMMQAVIIYSSFMCEFTTLVVMAYDRYVAICRPLEYNNTVSTQTVKKALLYTWIFPFILGFPNVMLASQLPLCGSNIDRLYCDNWSFAKLSCIPAKIINIYGFTLLGIFMAHALIIMYSYQRLLVACKNSADNKKKFIGTCGPHLLSLINFTTAALFDLLFSRYGSKDFPDHLQNAFQVEILVIPPLLNPLIYGLRLSEIRKRLFRKQQIMLSHALLPNSSTACLRP
ncbi:olfactory receptor 52E4-like [Electrophorus electricus]|uniref:olfactory receptor 52E4-like n=1 Tax=Electrophorus electricus TaxID=8005 RepID=UPI0015CFD990|nr:olfactory receptor 52E4-like [Electrophorus electricus]